MPMLAYLEASASFGQIKGSVLIKGREGHITVIAADHMQVSPRDDKTGQPVKGAQPKVLLVTKDIDASSPHFHRAQVEGASIDTFNLNFWRLPPGGGGEENYYTIKLEGARVASIRTVMPNARIDVYKMMPEYEEIAFTYEKITFHWKGKYGQSATGGPSAFQQKVEANFAREAPESNVAALTKWATDAGKGYGKDIGKEIGIGIYAALKGKPDPAEKPPEDKPAN